MEMKSEPLSGAAQPAPLSSGLYKVRFGDGSIGEAWFSARKSIWTTPDGASSVVVKDWSDKLKDPAAPMAVPAGPRGMEGDRCGILVRRDGEDAPCSALLPCAIHNHPAPPAPLPQPQEPKDWRSFDLRASISALMEAIEPFAQNQCLPFQGDARRLGTNKARLRAGQARHRSLTLSLFKSLFWLIVGGLVIGIFWPLKKRTQKWLK